MVIPTTIALVIVVRVSLLLASAVVVVALLRRSAAATRHLVWTAAIAGSLLVPALSLTVPAVEVALLPAPRAPVARAANSQPSGERAAVAMSPRVTPAPEPATSEANLVNAPSNVTSAWSAPRLLIAVWLGGLLLVLLRFALGTARMWVLSRRARRVDGRSWLRLAQRLAWVVGVKQPVRFLEGAAAAMPMTWGIWRPCVLLPDSAGDWPIARQRVVLLHELAHVKRRDCLTQLLAQLLCAMFWFNPLAWIAARQLQAERERACDDVVLAAGTKGSDYAEHLLQIARAMRSSMMPTWSAVAMAHRSQLEGRLLAILDPRVPRRLPARRRTIGLVTALGILLVPIVVVTPVPRAAELPDTDGPREFLTTRALPLPQPTPTPTPMPHPAGRQPDGVALGQIVREATKDAIPDATRDLVKEGWLTPVVAGTVRAIGEAIEQAVGSAVTESVAGGVSGGVKGGVQGGVKGGIATGVETQADRQPSAAAERRDPRAVAALIGALNDPDREVRESALQALAHMRAPEALDAMRAALKDSSASVREQAAFALGQYRDRASIDSLAAVLADSSPDVREQAVFALGQIRDPKSAPALAKALGDTNASVREQAAFALGQLRSREAVEPLIGALRDQSSDVREQAAFALGQIGDTRAIDALSAALKDADVEVRRMAAFALGQISR